MKQISVSYATGGDVLNAYWGFLANGGLVLEGQEGLDEGDPVTVGIRIESSQQQFAFEGHVARGTRRRADLADRTIVAFAPGQPHEQLLSAAWAATNNAPARKHPRVAANVTVRLRYSIGADEICKGRLLDVSRGGCCLRVAGQFRDLQIALSENVTVIDGGFEGRGHVRWSRASVVGIQFDESNDLERVDRYIASLAAR